MELKLKRYSSGAESTLGLLFQDGQWLCYTLEDEEREVKVRGETRIPAGRYRIRLRNEGGLDARYRARFPKIHKGMLHLQDVPNFQWVCIHCGNDDDDTAGCPLVGNSANNNQIHDGFISSSSPAYARVYPPVADAIEAGEDVFITVGDIGGRE